MRLEADFWRDYVRPLLNRPREGRLAWKVPAELRKGLPDVWFKTPGWTGWLELKYHASWPKRHTTSIEVPVTAEQLAHLREVEEVDCAAFVLMGIADWFFLLPREPLRPSIKYTRAELESLAVIFGRQGVDDSCLLTALGG
jgi:hypothetical protein